MMLMKPLLNEALKTMRWLQQNKHENLHVRVRYILIDENVHELPEWQRLFKGLPQEIWAYHYGACRQASKKLAGNHPLLNRYRQQRIKHYIHGRYPCNCFHNLAIGVHGEVMQCCDLPYEMNYGHFLEVDLREVWQKRLDVGLDHEGCQSCSSKNPRWRELFEKYVWS